MDTYCEQPLVLFDGVCKFCSASVEFVIKRNNRGDISFGQLQSAAGQQLLQAHGLADSGLTSMVLIHHGKAYTRSTAALRIAGLMNMPWPLMKVFLLVPPFIRHPVYNWIGRRRYRWFGKRSACWVPGADIENRFID